MKILTTQGHSNSFFSICFRNIFLAPSYVVVLFLLFGLQSCKKECPNGKQGENCDERSIEKFLGVWEGESTCFGGGNQINISLNGPIDSFKIAITGLIPNQSYPILGKANYATLVFEPNQNLADGVILTSCSGNLNPDGAIKIYYSYTDESVIPFVSKTCSFSGNLLSSNAGENFPVIITKTFTIINDTTVQTGGIISSDGGSPVTKRGVVWSLTTGPTINSPWRTMDGNGVGNFSSIIGGLEDGQTYYIRAYATNSAGTAYGNEITLQKPECLQNGELCVGGIYLNQGVPEGIIAYFLQPGDAGYDATVPHGLLISNSDLGSFQWGCSGIPIGGTSTALGSGEANTTAILNGCSDANCAARICANQGTGWYLPSKDELIKVYQSLTANGLGGLSYELYWTSSEDSSTPAYNAWTYNFADNNAEVLSKYNPALVRAVKKF